MKRIILLSTILLGTIYLINPFSQATISQEKEDETPVSGAYQALNFNGARQTYPNDHIPKGAYTKAWESLQNNNAIGRGGGEEGTWESAGPHNKGGRTLAMAFNPQNSNTLYAGSASGGLWRSYTEGQGPAAWERVAIGFPVLGVSSIAFAPGDSMTMYIGTGEVYNFSETGTGAAYRNTRGSWGMGILKSVDGGETWTKSLDWSYNENHGIWAIKIAPDNPNLIYATTTEGVYKSTNAGDSWDLILDVVMANDIVVKPSDPNQVIVTCGNFASEGYGVYKTTDGGDNWTKINSNIPVVYNGKAQLAMAPSDENIIYLSIGNGFGFTDGATWLCRSLNFGVTWQVRNMFDYSKWQGWFAHDIAVSPVDPDYLVIIGIEVWVSENGGLLMNMEANRNGEYENPAIGAPDGDENYVHSDCHDVIFHPDDPEVVYIASDGGMHRSEDAGRTWRSTNGAYQTVQFYNGISVSEEDESFLIGGLQDNGTIKWNGDLRWAKKTGGDGGWTAIATTSRYFTSSQRLEIDRTNNGSNFVSLDLGTAKQDPTSFIAPFVVAPSNTDVMYAGSSVIGRSTNGGSTWLAVNNNQPLDGNPILSMEVARENENVLYAATAPYNGNRGHVFVSVNGVSFTDVTGDLPDRYPMDITVHPLDEAIAYITFSGFGTGHVFRTTDYGGTWEDISGNLPDLPTNAIVVDPLFPDHIYVGNDFGVFVSIDNGATWSTCQEGLPEVAMVFDLKISSQYRKLRVATHGNGAYQISLPEAELSYGNPLEALNIKMFPNPSTGPFTLSFDNPKRQAFRIEIIDSSGRLVKLHSEKVFSSGAHSVLLDDTGFSTGTYYLRISTGEYSLTRSFQMIQ